VRGGCIAQMSRRKFKIRLSLNLYENLFSVGRDRGKKKVSKSTFSKKSAIVFILNVTAKS
jgi:hypothetical protein